MRHDETFPNAFVKKVLFQITFPNLFFLPSRIGDFQIKIMKQFPTSQLLIRRSMFLLDVTDQEKEEQLSNVGRAPQESGQVWQFISDSGIRLDISLGSLSLTSDDHKGYRCGDKPFRDTIDFVCREFIKLTQVPIIKRIGLRYIDECPVFGDTDEEFRRYYNSTFPLSRFPFENSLEMQCKAAVKCHPHSLRYVETLKVEGEDRKIILDFDAWSENVESDKLIDVTDELQEIIANEFDATLKEPALEYMRRKPEETNAIQPE